MSNIKNWSTTAANNNSSPPNGWPENMQLSDVNNSARQNMADVRGFAEELPFFDYGHTPTRTGATTFTVATDLTTTYVAGRRIKCTDSSTLYGTIASSSYGAPNTTVTVTLDSGSLSASLSAVALGTEVTGKAVSGTSIKGGTPQVDTISENTSATGVTVDGVLLKDSKVTATAGINFGSSDLAYYAEGSWTPRLGGSTAEGTQSYTTQVGTYVRIGKICVAQFRVIVNGAWDGSSTGNLRLYDLPFTSRNSMRAAVNFGYVNNTNLTAATQPQAYVESSTTRCAFYVRSVTGSANWTVAMIGSSMELSGTITYEVA